MLPIALHSTDQSSIPKAWLPEISKHYDRASAIHGIADQLVSFSLEVKSGDIVWIQFEVATRDIARLVAERIENISGAKYILSYHDEALDKSMLQAVSHDNLLLPISAVREAMIGNHILTSPKAFVNQDQSQLNYIFHGPLTDQALYLAKSNKILMLMSRRNLTDYKIDPEVEKAFASMIKPLKDVRVKGRRWCLYRPPTPSEADAAKMWFEDYEKLYYEACNRPWAEVEKAQSFLVERIAKGKKLKVISPPPPTMDDLWTTNIEMEIEGNKAVNSTAKRNMPGSEVFFAPNRGSLSGTFAVPYPVMVKDRVLPNLIFWLENGKVIRSHVEGTYQEQSHLDRILATDEGSAIIGEIGIGTNPVFRFPVINTMLNEKILGVHLAIGSAYTYTDYFGTEVNIDNGNRSDIHIDIARIMIPEYGGGQILVDDDIIFSDGKFLDERMAILNGEI